MRTLVTKGAIVGVLGIVASALVVSRVIEVIGDAIDTAHTSLQDEVASWHRMGEP